MVLFSHSYCFSLLYLRTNCLGEDVGTASANGAVQPFLSVPPGQIMDVHGQCQEIYGNTSFMCVSMFCFVFVFFVL